MRYEGSRGGTIWKKCINSSKWILGYICKILSSKTAATSKLISAGSSLEVLGSFRGGGARNDGPKLDKLKVTLL